MMKIVSSRNRFSKLLRKNALSQLKNLENLIDFLKNTIEEGSDDEYVDPNYFGAIQEANRDMVAAICIYLNEPDAVEYEADNENNIQ